MSTRSDTKLQSSFKLLGLDDLTRIIYLTLLDNGPSKARSISLTIDQPKTTTLEKLYELEKAGLVTKKKIKNSYEFYPENPGIISSLLTRLEKEIEHTRNKSATEIQELERKFAPTKLPEIDLFEGREELQKLYLKSVKSQSDIYSIGDTDSEARYLGNFAYDYWKLKANARIKSHHLVPNNQHNQDITKNESMYLKKSYFLPTKESPSALIQVYDTTTQIISFEDEFGIRINNRHLSETLRYLMQLLPLS
jgi:predicted transcriptional regulator